MSALRRRIYSGIRRNARTHVLARWVLTQVRRVKLRNIRHPDLFGRIDHRDDMFRGGLETYVEVGRSAMANLEAVLARADRDWQSIGSCLDMAAGWGRVLRWLVQKVPPNCVTACELEPRALEFLAREFRVTTVAAEVDFRQIRFGRKFDLVWVGSLFTHLDRPRFRQLFEVLTSVLEPGGILVMTTHQEFNFEENADFHPLPIPGRPEIERALRESGFFYWPYLHWPDYGISISTPELVLEEARQASGNRLERIYFERLGWARFQDVHAFRLS